MVGVDESCGEGSPERMQQRSSAPAPLGDQEFAERMQASFRVFWLIAMSIVRDAGLADDVVQEAAVIGLQKRQGYSPGTNFEAWIGTIVRNLARNRARKERRNRSVMLQPNSTRFSIVSESTRPSQEASQETVVNDGIGAREVDDRVRRWLDEVSEIARACLILRTIEGLDYAEISRLLEIPEGTAMSHVHRTRKLLRARLAEQGFDDGRKEPRA